MKSTERIIFALVALLVAGSLIAATPIKNLVFQTNVDAGGYQITNLATGTNASNAVAKSYVDTFLGSTNITRLGTVTNGTWAAGIIATNYGGTGSTNGISAAAQAALDAKQPLDSDLTSISSLATTAFGRALLTLADAPTTRGVLGLGNVENTALSTWAGSWNITTLGNVTAGQWLASPVDIAYGGTGASSQSGARTALGLAIGANVQAWDADLTALAGAATNGLWALTGNGTGASRTITAPAAGITITNGDGVAGDPTLALANDLAAAEGLSSTGLVTRTADGSWTARQVTVSTAGLGISNGSGVSGNPVLSLINDAYALESLSGAGIAVRTGTDAWAQRTITGTAGQVTVTNGDGVSGNPTISLPADITQSQTFSGATFTQGDSASDDFVANDDDPRFPNLTFTSFTAAGDDKVPVNGNVANTRYTPMSMNTAGGAGAITTGTHGAFTLSAAGDLRGYVITIGAWTTADTISSRASLALSPARAGDSFREHFLVLRAGNGAGNSYSRFFFFTQAGDRWDISAGDGKALWCGTSAYIGLSAAITVADGDVLTDGLGASAVCSAGTATTNPQFRWITGTQWFTTGATVYKNSVSTGLTVANAGNGPASANADSVLFYDGKQNSGDTTTLCVWNNTSSSKFVTVRVWR